MRSADIPSVAQEDLIREDESTKTIEVAGDITEWARIMYKYPFNGYTKPWTKPTHSWAEFYWTNDLSVELYQETNVTRNHDISPHYQMMYVFNKTPQGYQYTTQNYMTSFSFALRLAQTQETKPLPQRCPSGSRPFLRLGITFASHLCICSGHCRSRVFRLTDGCWIVPYT